METPTKSERYIKASNEGKFLMNEELEMVQHSIDKFNFISLSQYAKKEGVSPQGAKSRMIAKNEAYIKLAGKILIVK